MAHLDYIPEKVCSKFFSIDVNDETQIIETVEIIGGCPGNLAAICQLVKGRKIADVIELLKDIPCRPGMSSCPAQLAIALEQL
ncbi:TIGR03905 family TSCPD domain-containing protein [Lentisphaerota bacterium WC36G]|nr:TIGR03905 family TSCPD domain-containing protein [Lentisphaerae bacterium WC36]